MWRTLKHFLASLQKWWLFALIFVIPLALKYVTKEPFAISWLNLISVGFIGLGFLNLVTGVTPLQPLRHRPFIWLIGLFLVAMAYALLFTDPLRNGVGLWTSRLMQPLLVGFFAYQIIMHKRVRAGEVVAAFFWSIVPLLVLGAFQALGIIEYRDPGRITAAYFYPNTFARYMDIILLVSLPWILFHVKQGKRLFLGVWVLGVILLLTSKSYNGTVSLFAGVVMLLTLLPHPFSMVKRVSLVSLFLVVLMVAVNAPKLPKWQTSITDSRLTRLEFWDVASHVIRENFWTGIGIKTWEQNYPQYVEKYGPFPPLNWGSVQPHNVFLDSLLKAGLPGLFTVTALLLWPIFEGISYSKIWTARRTDWWFGVSVASYGVAMVVFGLIDDPLWSDDTVPVLFILLFTLVALVQQAQPHRQVKTNLVS